MRSLSSTPFARRSPISTDTRRLDLARLKADADAQNMVLFAIYRAAQGCIDLAHHIVADEGLRVPATYRGVFESLREAGWLDSEAAQRLALWAGLRNVIAHAYTTIDFERIHEAVVGRDDLRAFCATVASRIAECS